MTKGKKAKRDNDYYLDRLQGRNVAVYDDFRAGKYATLADALKAAGMKKARTRLQELNNAWAKASAAEQDEFIRENGIFGAPAAPITVSATPFAVGGYLEPHAIKRIQDIMKARSMKMGDLMHELGLKRLNPSVGRALSQGTLLKKEVVDDLEMWAAKH